jgi:hypothetical protein
MRPKAFKVTLRRRRSESPVGKANWIFVGGLLVVVLALVVRSVLRHSALIDWRSSLAEEGMPATWPTWDPAWPPLPKPPPRVSRSPEGFHGPYAFAARHPDILRSIPCYCGCRREAHDSVLACFVKRTTTSGLPVWNDHGLTCPMCVNIVGETMLMSRRGMSVRAIRDAIDSHYGGPFSRSTETPASK